jgi:hypothetical protein
MKRLTRRCGNGQDNSQKRLCCGFRLTRKAMGQVYQCWWRIPVCREINVFFSPSSSITCFAFYIHLWLIYWLSVVLQGHKNIIKAIVDFVQQTGRNIFVEFVAIELLPLNMFKTESHFAHLPPSQTEQILPLRGDRDKAILRNIVNLLPNRNNVQCHRNFLTPHCINLFVYFDGFNASAHFCDVTYFDACEM